MIVRFEHQSEWCELHLEGEGLVDSKDYDPCAICECAVMYLDAARSDALEAGLTRDGESDDDAMVDAARENFRADS